MKSRVFFTSLFWVCVFSFFLTSVYSIDIPSHDGFVNDKEGIIENVQELEKKIVDFEEATGVEIAVLTTPDFSDTYIEDYAVRVFEAWGIGKKDLDNGVLIIVSKEQRQSRIEVGYGLEGILTDSFTGRIQDSAMIPHFREDKYSEGINSGVQTIMQVLEGEEIPGITGPDEDEIAGALVGFGFFVVFFMLFVPNQRIAGVVSGLIMLVVAGLSFGSVVNGLMWGMVTGLVGVGMSYLGAKLPKSDSTSSSGGSGSSWSRSSSSSWGGGGGGGFGGGSSGGGGSSRGW